MSQEIINMAITYQSEMKEGLLTITASGRDDNSQQVIDYGTSIINLAVLYDARLILCDERNLDYALGTFETFEAAKTIAKLAPKVARIAVLCKPEFLNDGKFWETVAVNRGLQVRMDIDLDRAQKWLMKISD